MNTKVDLAIDDGCLSIESIQKTCQTMMPHMAKRLVYFIEDNLDSYDVLARRWCSLYWAKRDEMREAARGSFR